MMNRNTIAKLTALTLGLAGLSAPALADRSDAFHFSDELDACVAALTDELDLSGVYRVRHIVTKSQPQGSGYTLTIETRTFSESAERKYSAVCKASGNNRPSRLKIDETKT